MITFREIAGKIPINDISFEIQFNIEELIKRMNVIRAAWGRPMVVSSGLRTDYDQRRINPKAPKSKHLIGCAVDIYDPKQELQAWLLQNVKILEETGLWCEDFSATPRWVHFQTLPPKSGKRFFLP